MFKNTILRTELEKRSVEREPDIRGNYYRDQTAIIHSRPFRRLKSKTQVFFSPDDDHVCTRIEHVLHVASIAGTICKGLKSKEPNQYDLDEELAYAIGLGHDIGHAPFGHAGEDELNYILGGKSCFIHETNGYRVVEKLANRGEGLNLTYAVKDGIICHNGENFEQSLKPMGEIKDLEKIKDKSFIPSTYEGCIVRFSDKIAYLGRDIEDAIVADFLKIQDIPIPISKVLGKTNGEIINHLVFDVISASSDGEIRFSDDCFKLIIQLKEFNYHQIYTNPRILEYRKYCKRMVSALFSYLTKSFSMYHWDIDWYFKTNLELDKFFGNYITNLKPFYEKEKAKNNWNEGQLSDQIVTDYIAGMTDKFVINCMREISIPKPIEFKPRLRKES